MRYGVVAKDDLDELMETVTRRLQAGWEPLGGIEIDPSPERDRKFYQAIVKPEGKD